MNAVGRRHQGPEPQLTLDISRLLSRAGEAVPTGIDRVELAYAEYLLEHAPDRTRLAAVHPLGRFGLLPAEHAARFIALLSARWDRAAADDGSAVRAGRRLLHGLMLPGQERDGRLLEGLRLDGLSRGAGRAVYLLLSHHHLTRPAVIAETLARRGALFVPMVHDLIPSDYPEYARAKEPARHLARMRTVARYADGVLVPSETTRQSLLPHLRAAGREAVPVKVVRHGVHLRAMARACGREPPGQAAARHPYFVCLGTIEPRKNHLLLLNIWRRLVESLGAAAPRLVLIGRRGWEVEHVTNMIERCPGLQSAVTEHNALPDAEVTRLLTGARALLLPSFAEGYGLPLAEALALGVPVICSDIPVFREVGGDAAEYVDPLDGLGWLRAVEQRTRDAPRGASTASARALPDWPDSVAEGLRFVETVLC